MKREEQIKKASVDAYNSISKLYEEGKLDGSFAKIFQLGADWADNNPVNPWVNVKDRLPEEMNLNHTSDEVIVFWQGGIIGSAIYNHEWKRWEHAREYKEVNTPLYWMPYILP